jgi:hypothetical protein
MADRHDCATLTGLLDRLESLRMLAKQAIVPVLLG